MYISSVLRTMMKLKGNWLIWSAVNTSKQYKSACFTIKKICLMLGIVPIFPNLKKIQTKTFCVEHVFVRARVRIQRIEKSLILLLFSSLE